MKTSQHPAARPRPLTAAEDSADRDPAPVFAEVAPPEEEHDRPSAPVGEPDTQIPDGPGDGRDDDAPLLVEPDAGAEDATWEPIDTAPQDGRDVAVRYSADDEQGRLVRWREGRRFTGRRWVPGGAWVPSDNMMPLPLAAPTHWLRYPETETANAEAEEVAA